MTREERHIAVLSRLLENMDVYDSVQPTEERKKAIKAAIKALSSWEKYSDKLWKEAYERGKAEALSQEPSNDAISKKTLKHRGMTREQNIRAILECNFSEAKEELIDIAVKNIMALEQEPCEDAISREDVIKLIECSGYDLQYRSENADMCDDVRKLPSVQPKEQEPKYWINKDNNIYKLSDVPTITVPQMNGIDMVSREQVLNVIADFVTFEEYIDENHHLTFVPLEKKINMLPSVQPNCKGHWIECETNIYSCSYCSHSISITPEDNDINELILCPFCGAEMESEE